MEINFSKSGEGAVPVDAAPTSANPETPNTSTAVATTQPLPLGAPQSALSEIVLPKLNLVHSVGLLKDSFIPGSYVHAQSLVLYTPPLVNQKTQKVEREGTPPLNVTFLDLRPLRYYENVRGGGMGQIADSLDEVARLGGTANYQEFKLKEKDGMKRFDKGISCLLAVERPEAVSDDDTVFVFDVDGKKYALCLYTMKASAYTVLKQTVLTHQHIGCLRKGTATHSYSLSSCLKPTPDKSSTYWCPVLVPAKPSTPAFIEFAKQVLGTPTVESSDGDVE